MISQPDNTSLNSTSTTGSSTLMTAIFTNREAAETAYDSLLSHGFSTDDVNIVMTDETRKQHFDASDSDDSALTDKALEGVGKGSAIGGTVGAVAAAIAAIGTTLALPGLGLLIAGPLAAGLAGAGAGGLAGGLIGALVNSGIPEETAKAYESGLKSGGIVVGVHPRDEADRVYLTQQGFH
ncbi:hypothetical protein EXU85_24510 [Spirosoma sp. KCTC 42546]|uniref:hypothetical protein n=1 Tax=Spirosoma sp. KCTC 42546 TaxID=2520506 RepID=UPI001156CDA0|nr:hypothetical protein [Spirosoma sp. KCTC 42546]QDK81602.1 hypothetical protein EXU85_24510 [Spirosoma sp. KCTC 42546]